MLEHIWALFSVEGNCNATATQAYSRQRFEKLPGYGCKGVRILLAVMSKIKPLSFSVERLINRINNLINVINELLNITFLC